MHSFALILAFAAFNAVFFTTSSSADGPASDTDFLEAVLFLSGAADESELSESELDSYRRMAARPLRINAAGRAALQSCGLFSTYQVETILDWRRRTGPILSAGELSVIDGFNASIASHMALFLDFGAASLRGREDFATDSLGRTLLKEVLDVDAACGLYFKASGLGTDNPGTALVWNAKALSTFRSRVGEWQFSAAAREGWAFSAAYSGGGGGRLCLSNAVVGNFNARFGQGLLQWSGLQFTTTSSPSALMMRPNGVRAYTSYSQDHALFGAAARMDAGSFSISPWVHLGNPSDFGDPASFRETVREQGSAGVNTTWYHRYGQVGATVVTPFQDPRQSGLSLDFQQSINWATVYGEFAANLRGGISALLGTRFQLGRWDNAVRCSYSASEHNVSASTSCQSSSRRHTLTISPNISYYQHSHGHTPAGAAQIKASIIYNLQPSEPWKFTTRISFKDRFLSRYADPSAPYASSWATRRIELRQDAVWDNSTWLASGRINVVMGDSFFEAVASPSGAYEDVYSAGVGDSDLPVALLGCVEMGYRHPLPSTAVYFQAGAFCIDKWNDRIWVYQRDAPSNFNVSQMYGRGLWAAAYASVRVCSFLYLYLRADCTAYPWARDSDTRRGATLSARVQLRFKF